MTDTARSFRFGPSSAHGAMGLPLSWLQLGVASAGLLAGYEIFMATSVAGMPVALAVIVVTLGVSFMPARGRPLVDWLPLALFAVIRRLTGRHRKVSGVPTAGFTGSAGDPSGPGTPPDVDLPSSLSHIEILSVQFGADTVGIVKDKMNRTWGAIVKVRVSSYGLLSSSEQERRMDGWSGLLSNLCREETPISRLQWIERTIPSDVDELARWYLSARNMTVADEQTMASYEQLIMGSTAATQDHELFLMVQISWKRAQRLIKRMGKNVDEGACLLLEQELHTIADGLIGCDVEPIGVLKPRTIAKTIKLAYDPFQRRAIERLGSLDPGQDGLSAQNAWPLATQVEWDHYRTDGAFHATYWVSEWPRRDVGAAFMLPLLLNATVQRSISVVMEPQEITKALASVEKQIVGNQTSEEIKRSKGFVTTARRAKRSQDLIQRESELAAGFGEFRFAGYVTVSGTTHDELERACAKMEHAALRSRLQVQRLRGLQDEAFTYTLPLGRGLGKAA